MEHSENKKQTVFSAASGIITKLEALSEKGNEKAILAAIRNTSGKSLESAVGIWQFLFENLPAEMLGTGRKATYEENSIYTMLQLYAISKQGSSKIVVSDEKAGNIGASLRGLRSESSDASDRRFNAMMNAQSFEEFTMHLRHLVKIAKAKGNLSINFPQLANDLYWYQNGQARNVCFSWAREYFFINNKFSEEK